MKHFIIINAIYLMISSTLTNAEDINKTSIKEKIEVRMPQLSDVKLNKLMKYVGKPVPDKFFQCLCGPGMTGGGVTYKPGSPCRATGVLGGSWDQGFNRKAYKGCIKYAKYEDNTTIVDVLSSNIIPIQDKVAGDTLSLERLNKLEKRLLLKNEKYKSLCLPTFSKNFEKLIWDGSRGDIIQKALEIADHADNICEEAVSVFLFLGGHEGRTYFEIGTDLVIGYKMPNQFDVASKFAELLPLAEAVPVLNVLSKALTIKSSIELLDEEYAKSKSNKQFLDAYQLFQESKHWTAKNQNLYEKLISNEVNDLNREIDQKYSKLNSEINNIYPTIREIQVFGREYLPGTKVPNEEVVWKKYRRNKNRLIKSLEMEIGPLLHKRAGLIMKKNVIKNYRKPLTQKGCKKFLKDRESICTEELARKSKKDK